MVKPLTVYKASAGSGKTFALAAQYIKLVVQNPQAYRNILAVTFTNKATEEMKMRILSQLYGISKQLPESNDYMERILESTDLSAEQVSERAGLALHLLLHNYNYFRVETIDTFFQSVLRNLARELDLTANLRVGLNDTQVEEQAVDRLIDRLTHSDVMLQWILKYIMESISEDRSWNIIGQVKQFGRTIFRDYYKEHSLTLNQKLDEEGFLEGYMGQMRQIKKSAAEHMQQYADSFFDTLQSEGLSDSDLPYGKSGVAGFFYKLRNGQLDEGIVGARVADCQGDPSKWYKKSADNRDHIHALADSTLIPLLRQAMEDRPRQYRLFKSADLILRHLNQLRLLGSIERQVRLMNEEANRFLLSDTQQLLHSLIKDSDSPFIFEKIGTQLEHVMIDEFQDTSTVQWQNFKVLLEECMSHADTENLIVGDVKQSIYRWRSGDWRLLNAIDREFLHADQVMDILPLKTNYRSERNIIDFNNAFFTEAARQEYEQQQELYPSGSEQLRHAYADVAQDIPQKRAQNGYVNVQLLPANDYHEQMLATLGDAIAGLLERGVAPRQMAILVRTNRYIPLIADYLAEQMPQVPIVSDEAFRLDASTAVCLIVQAMQLLTHPDDILSKATVAKIYQRSVLGNKAADNELFIVGRPLDDLLPEAFVQHTDDLLQLPLYELAERLYSIFQLERLNEQSAYICAFYDQLNKFTQDESTDITAFIREWEETICAKTIQSTETDGIRILSIHKSKGLEFEHVIIPYCDWRLEHADILWCHPHEAPFDALPIVPVDYSGKQMMGTIFEHDYLDERLQNTVDNLNLLYVAFTRAEKSLFVIGRRDDKSSRSVLVQNVVTQLKLPNATLDGEEDAEAPLTFTYGNLVHSSPQERSVALQSPTERSVAMQSPTERSVAMPSKTSNVFLAPVTPKQLTLETFEPLTEFRQSNQSREFIEGDDQESSLSYIKMGSVLHEVFSTIRTTADIDRALQQLQHDGVLYDDEVTREKVSALLRKRLESPRVKDWFSDRWQLFNECKIIFFEDGVMKERRPDRVMTDGRETHVVDFKFGNPHEEYHEQVREYMSLLRSMQMPRVRGWLWYIYINKVEEVREDER